MKSSTFSPNNLISLYSILQLQILPYAADLFLNAVFQSDQVRPPTFKSTIVCWPAAHPYLFNSIPFVFANKNHATTNDRQRRLSKFAPPDRRTCRALQPHWRHQFSRTPPRNLTEAISIYMHMNWATQENMSRVSNMEIEHGRQLPLEHSLKCSFLSLAFIRILSHIIS